MGITSKNQVGIFNADLINFIAENIINFTSMIIKINHSVFIVFFISLLVGCSGSFTSGDIDLDRDDDVSVHDLFSEIRVVVPENHPDYVISTIYNVEYHNGKYYIFDIRSQQIFCLDENGTFHFKISASGHGPGEYVYVGHMSIDRFNEQILLTEPSMQRLQVFDLNGQYVQTYNISGEVSLAYNFAFPLNTDTILLISITGDQLIYFCRKNKEIIKTDFPMAISEGVFPFFPTYRNFYQFNNRSFFLPVLSQQVFDITNMKPQPYFLWNFGIKNNTEKHYSNLIKDLSIEGSRNMAPFDFVGHGKTINNDIVKIAETSRYKIAIIEYNSDYKHVIIDKELGSNYVFRAFREGVSLMFLNIFNNLAIGSAVDYDFVTPAYRKRILSRFHPSVLSKEERIRIESWDEIKDNMFFVVYKFKE
jgi:hypothetical protein